MPIKEFYLDKVLAELNFTYDEVRLKAIWFCFMVGDIALGPTFKVTLSVFQFIDLCILLGCDYCDSIRGIGPKRAIELMRQHKSIDSILKHLDKSVSSLFTLFSALDDLFHVLRW